LPQSLPCPAVSPCGVSSCSGDEAALCLSPSCPLDPAFRETARLPDAKARRRSQSCHPSAVHEGSEGFSGGLGRHPSPLCPPGPAPPVCEGPQGARARHRSPSSRQGKAVEVVQDASSAQAQRRKGTSSRQKGRRGGETLASLPGPDRSGG